MQRIGTLSTLGFILLAGILCPTLGSAENLADVRKSGRLTMLCWPHQESAFVRRMVAEYGRDGLQRFTGVDVEILRLYAASLGVELEVKPVKNGFSELIPALVGGEGHVIGSSLTITRKRAEKIDFSVPYHSVKKVVMARRGSGFGAVADLAGRTAATVAGSSHEEHLLALGFEDVDLRYADFMLETYSVVAAGDADFAVVDSGSAERVLAEHPSLATQLEKAFVFPQDDEYGFAVPRGSDLRKSLDAFLKDLRESGELERIRVRHSASPSERKSEAGS